MLTLKKLLTRINIQYEDNQEEQEFTQIKFPLVRDFFKYLFLTFTLILTLYAIRYFVQEVSPQDYILVGVIILGILLFFIQHKISKNLELLLLLYVLAVVSVFISVFTEINKDSSRQYFYVGYAFAMMHRLIGYRVIKFKYMIWLYIVSLAIKLPLIPNPDGILTAIIICLDLATIALGYKSERDERSLFDALYRSKKDILKFKHLLTQYLPNQMTIFANDYSRSFYMNNSFKRTFGVLESAQVKESLNQLVVEKDTIEKNKILFRNFGHNTKDEDQTITLSGFMSHIADNFDLLRELGVVTIPVIEAEPIKNESIQIVESGPTDRLMNTEVPLRKVSQDNKQEPTYGLIDNNTDNGQNNNHNDSHRSHDRASSRSTSSELGYEEGRRRVFRVKIFPLLWDDTEAIAMVFDDMTQQRIIMELKVADKNKDLVIAMVSHELRTPLNGMLGLIDIAKKNITDHGALFYLSACRDSGMLLLNLVNSILDMNQLKSKKLRLVYTPISIPDLLKETKMLFNQTCRIKNLYFNIEIAQNVPKLINTDKNRLSQILINLLGNAFKFTFKGGVTVKVELEGKDPCRVRFSVEDTGIGIKKEDQAKLFQMYGKIEQQDRKINTHGIGLGLTISNSLAVLLNPISSQRIQVRSEVDKGTCFSFVIESQSLEAMKKLDPSLGDISSLALVEDKDTTILKKMTTYASQNNDNFSKMIGSTQNLDSRASPNLDRKKTISPILEKKVFEYKGTKSLPVVPTIPIRGIGGGKKNYPPKNIKAIKDTLQKADEIILRIPESSERELLYEEREEEYNEIEEESGEETQSWCLIVDDNPFNLMVANHIMEDRGYKVKTALNGKEAISKASEQNFNGRGFKIILMDCQMPVMDGYEATKILKKMMQAGELAECPIIALTANNRDEEHEKLCQDVGMSGHVAKPLQVDELEAVLKLIL